MMMRYRKHKSSPGIGTMVFNDGQIHTIFTGRDDKEIPELKANLNQ